MARQVPATVTNLIASHQGIEAILVIGIQYREGLQVLYADRDLGDPQNPTIKGKILSVEELEAVTKTDGGGDSVSISFTLDDSDGFIKGMMDSVDLTNCKAYVYQYFNSLPLSDLVLMFNGRLASPIEWDEGKREVTLTAMTDHAVFDVGFTLGEAVVDTYHQDLIDKPWPMIFGSPLYSTMLPLQEFPTGTIIEGFGTPSWQAPNASGGASSDITQSIGGVTETTSQVNATDPFAKSPSQQAQEDFDAEFAQGPPKTALKGTGGGGLVTDEDIQRHLDTIWLDNSDWYKQMDARQAEIDRMREGEDWPQTDAFTLDLSSGATGGSPGSEFAASASSGGNAASVQKTYPFKSRNLVVGGYRFPQGIPLICKINEQLFQLVFLGGTTIPDDPEEPCPIQVKMFKPPFKFRWGQFNSDKGGGIHQAGSKVELIDSFPGGYKHVVSLTPGTITGVYAYRNYNGTKRLSLVPPHYYTTTTEELDNGLIVTYLNLKRQLSTLTFYENYITVQADNLLNRIGTRKPQPYESRFITQIDWEDQLFVNFESSVGPNPVAIMRWIITNYTKLTMDATSFAYVEARLANYPANFALYESVGVDKLLSDIAYQSRCAIWTNNGVYYLKYLPDDAAITSTITGNDILFGSLRIKSTNTDDVVTKYIATWKPDGIRPQNRLVLKNNVGRYGVKEESHDFFIYNNPDLVEKSATFWMIRKSYVWKLVTCELLLSQIAVETLDDVRLQLGNTMVTTNSYVDCQVESAKYNVESHTISVELWTPIRFGEMTPFKFARPANLSATDIYPPFNDTDYGSPPDIPLAQDAGVSVPPYNAIGSNGTGGVTNVTTNNGYKTRNRPASKGDINPSDTGDIYFHPNRTPPIYKPIETLPDIDIATSGLPVSAGPVNDDEPLGIPAQSPPPKSSGDLDDWKTQKGMKKPRAVPAQVISGSGQTWQLLAYPLGPEGESITVTATECHGVGTLSGIEGEWVTLYRHVNDDDRVTFSFRSAEYAAMPVKMASRNSGEIHPHGAEAEGSSRVVRQIQLNDSFDIPANTWGICVRTFSSGTCIYEVQIPVWIPAV